MLFEDEKRVGINMNRCYAEPRYSSGQKSDKCWLAACKTWSQLSDITAVRRSKMWTSGCSMYLAVAESAWTENDKTTKTSHTETRNSGTAHVVGVEENMVAGRHCKQLM